MTTYAETYAQMKPGTIWVVKEEENCTSSTYYLITEVLLDRVNCARLIPQYTDLFQDPDKENMPGHFSYTLFLPDLEVNYRQVTLDEYAEVFPLFIKYAQAELTEAIKFHDEKRSQLKLLESFKLLMTQQPQELALAELELPVSKNVIDLYFGE
ncbi:MAG: hypothetical protein ACRC2V_19280 [Xenococcaceae cyanobacterium]